MTKIMRGGKHVTGKLSALLVLSSVSLVNLFAQGLDTTDYFPLDVT